ncbi:MAG: class I mannose-6-phosphate isomerase [Prevotellaceae bacterium]|jgi:mannose-6-phosphate isomerase|nr:class I mannose-6-phosphate isomerase [Prevotellaceae bacterium]
MELYPLKFKPIFKEIVWGGSRMRTILGKSVAANKNIGESWELSGVKGNLSVVSNGYLKGNNIEELIEVYMGELVGEKVYGRFGQEFPLLIKFIDANEPLSVQVHPDDATAAQRHHAYGKTEMWHVLDAEPNAELIVGFRKETNLTEMLEHIEKNTLRDILNVEPVKAGESYFIPAGCIHAIGKGLLIAEIQQTSDVTYRVYDWGRNLPNRPLHIDLAMDVICYHAAQGHKIAPPQALNRPEPLASCPYFTTNKLTLTQGVRRSYAEMDSFVAYICTGGAATVGCGGQSESVSKGETLLIPASLAGELRLEPQGKAELLEVYIEECETF